MAGIDGYEEQVLELAKAKLGLRTTVRDQYLLAIIRGVIEELKTQQGIKIDQSRSDMLMFIADYVAYRYLAHGETSTEMPRHLQWRLHNMFVTREDSDGI